MKIWIKRGAWIVVAAVILVALVRAFRPVPVFVDVETVERGTIRVTVSDDGRTRVRERYTISAPIAGRLLRPLLEAGDPVSRRKTLVAELVATPPSILDDRTLAEATARVARSEAAVREAVARREQADADLAFAVSDLERVLELATRSYESETELDRAERDERRAREGLRAAEFGVRIAEYELELARASLRRFDEDAIEDANSSAQTGSYVDENLATGGIRLRSPVDGTVLRVFEESARTLAAGAPILEIGDTTRLEVVADFLTRDAVRVRSGMTARIRGWGGRTDSGLEHVLEGRVRVVEPGGYLKVSALGVEEQRVDIRIDPAGDALEGWSALGDEYRVTVEIEIDIAEDALLVPIGALLGGPGDWSVLVVEDNVAAPRDIDVGRRGGLHAEVLAGLDAGNVVVLYPSDLVRDGTPVRAR